MRTYYLFIIIVLASLMMPMPSSALTTNRVVAQRIDSLKQQLAQSTTYTDSIRNLNDIFELTSSRNDRIKLGEKIYNVARRKGDNATALAIIRNLARAQQKDANKLNNLLARIDSIPDSPEKRETDLYVTLLKIDLKVGSSSHSAQSEELSKLVQEYKADTISDPYSRVIMLYTLSCHLRLVSRGNLLMNYYDRLEDLLSDMDLRTGAVRNLVYSRAAPIFTANGEHARAVATDKKLLNSIDSLQLVDRTNGRRYRDMSNIKYTTFTRMLSNYKALTPSEIKNYYNQVLQLAAENEAIDADLAASQAAHIYYNLAMGNDKWCLNALREQLKKTESWAQRYYYLSALTEVAQRLGDRVSAGDAAIELNKMLQEQIADRSEEHYRELQVIYDVKELAAEREELLRESHAKEMRNTHITIGVIILVLLIVGFALAYVIARNRRIHQVSAELETTAANLRQERNNLRAIQEELIEARDQAKTADRLKTEFVNNMSHEVQAPLNAIAEYSRLIVDCIPRDKANYLDRFADIIDINTKLIMTLVSDVLDVAALERKQMSVEKRTVGIQRICEFAIGDAFEKQPDDNPEVTFVFNPDGKPDVLIDTDGKRVGQILINLLDNARKFTESGFITLDYDVDQEKGKATFTVTDTGIGVPRSQEEEIFNRFRKLNSSATGCGLGLYISRLIANLLGGSLTLDSDYRQGARFILTIPV